VIGNIRKPEAKNQSIEALITSQTPKIRSLAVLSVRRYKQFLNTKNTDTFQFQLALKEN
jgi:hypothetical protein